MFYRVLKEKLNPEIIVTYLDDPAVGPFIDQLAALITGEDTDAEMQTWKTSDPNNLVYLHHLYITCNNSYLNITGCSHPSFSRVLDAATQATINLYGNTL